MSDAATDRDAEGASEPAGSARRRAVGALTALGFALFGLAATLGPVAGSRAAAADDTPHQCKIVVKGAPWHIRGSGSGNKYTIAAEGMSCVSIRARVIKYTYEPGEPFSHLLRGPHGELPDKPHMWVCESLRVAASGDNLQYSGVCKFGDHNIPFFEWGPLTKRLAARPPD